MASEGDNVLLPGGVAVGSLCVVPSFVFQGAYLALVNYL